MGRGSNLITAEAQHLLFGPRGQRGGAVDVSSGQLKFQRTFTDEVITEPVAEGILLVRFAPAQVDPDDPFALQPGVWLIEASAAQRAINTDDPVASLVDPQQTRQYHLLAPGGQALLDQHPYNKLDLEAVFVTDPLPAARSGSISAEQLLAVDSWDGSFWRPGDTRPRTRPYELTIGSLHYDLNQAQQRVDTHPWVLSSEQMTNPVSSNYEFQGRSLLKIVCLLDQTSHDRLDDWQQTRLNRHISSSLLSELFDWSARDERQRQALGDLDTVFINPFGLNQTARADKRPSR
jgi:hypothetical protein